MKYKTPTHDPQTGKLNPYYKELTGEDNPFDIISNGGKDLGKMPNQKWHRIVSFVKSGVRIVGYIAIPFNLELATALLISSEIVGILEELV